MKRALAAATLLAALTSCGSPTPAASSQPGGKLAATYREAGVSVTVTLDKGRLTATYRPDRAGFHLYSAAMPADGVDGLGRPTVLTAGHGLIATGPATADREPTTLHEAELGVDLPVYPDGPVTLTLPVTVAATPAEAVIGYAACSATQCLMPVTAKTITLH